MVIFRVQIGGGHLLQHGHLLKILRYFIIIFQAARPHGCPMVKWLRVLDFSAEGQGFKSHSSQD